MAQERTMELAALDDQALALSLKSGNAAAFEELVRRHQGRVYAVAYRMTGNRDDALDIAQESLLKAYRKIGSWEPTGNFLPWLLRLTANQSIDHLRRWKRHRHQPLDEAYLPETEGAAVEPAAMGTESNVRAHEIDARVRKSLDVLSPAQKTVFVLRHYEGLPLADIAQQLGCTVGSVKVHLFRALKKLQKELSDLV